MFLLCERSRGVAVFLAETAAPATTTKFKCANMRRAIQSAVGKPVNVMCFENSSDNLSPNPLIGSQCSLLRAHKAGAGENLLEGSAYTWATRPPFTAPRTLSGKSLAVNVPMLKALPIKVHLREIYFRTLFEEFPFA